MFIDEFEAFVPARSELGGHQQYKAEEVNEFLANLEGCAERKVLVIAATNEPEKIDPAVRRSGRFDKLIFIAPPDAEARRAMLDFHLRDRPVEASLDTAGIATVLDGYSASDIKLLVDEASRMVLKVAETISTGTLLAALERVPASITATDVQRYSAFRARGSGGDFETPYDVLLEKLILFRVHHESDRDSHFRNDIVPPVALSPSDCRGFCIHLLGYFFLMLGFGRHKPRISGCLAAELWPDIVKVSDPFPDPFRSQRGG